MKYPFDRDYWKEQMMHPDWYIKVEKELREYFFPINKNDLQLSIFRHYVYDLVAEMLERKEVGLATSGPDLDTPRQPITKLIVHHTKEDPAISLAKLSAIGLIRQYGMYYLDDALPGIKLKGQPVWSNHFYKGNMVFFAYHWLVREDGSVKRLLEDKYLSFHAGVWDVNTSSVAIALSGNYEHATPPNIQIASAAEIIKTHYPHIPTTAIFAHREVRDDRTCPGENYENGWKKTLFSLL
ncbi:MAG: peptidoglycan recognition protein family protein [Candidatus Levyibacteriota bacterium]